MLLQEVKMRVNFISTAALILSVNLTLIICQNQRNVSRIASHNSTKTIVGWHRKSVPTTTAPILRDKNKLRGVIFECTTPNHEKALCTPIKTCSVLLDQLENKEAKAFLLNSRCGTSTDPKNPLVCCGSYGNYYNASIIKLKTKPKSPLPKKCGTQKPIRVLGRILGGKEAALGEYPWMARLMHRNKYKQKSFGCSGFLIHSKYILTAAHCLDTANIEVLGPLFEIQLGEHNTQEEIDCNSKKTICADKPQVIRVKCNIIHPQYNRNSHDHHYDIGLIRLRKAVRITDYVYPICLLEQKNFNATLYWISGWGKTENRAISPIKMKLSMPTYPIGDCKAKYSGINIKVIENQICAGGKKNQDSCTGDSGGPLMVANDTNRWYAAGIVSYGLGCGREGWPGVYTNIPHYIDWIKNEITKRATEKEERGKSKSKVSKQVKNLNLCPKI